MNLKFLPVDAEEYIYISFCFITVTDFVYFFHCYSKTADRIGLKFYMGLRNRKAKTTNLDEAYFLYSYAEIRFFAALHLLVALYFTGLRAYWCVKVYPLPCCLIMQRVETFYQFLSGTYS